MDKMMNISYMICLPCKVKDKMIDEEFIIKTEILKGVQGQINFDRLVGGKEINADYAENTVISVREHSLSIKEGLSMTNEILQKSEYCKSCHISMGGSIGCHSFITLPLTNNADQYLLNKAIISWESEETSAFIDEVIVAQSKNDIDSTSNTIKLKKQGLSYAIDSNLIKSTLFQNGKMSKEQRLKYLLYSGQAYTSNKQILDTMSFYNKEINKWIVYHKPPDELDAGIVDLQHYFFCIFLSLMEDVDFIQWGI